MKKFFIIIMLGLLIGIGIGVIGQFQVSSPADDANQAGQLLVSDDEQNYIKIMGRDGSEFAFNPAILIILFILAFAFLYVTLRLIIGLVTAPRRSKAAWRSRRQRKAREGLQRGLLQLAEGEWAKAERTLQRSAKHSDIPMLHHLGAARAAQLQQASERRDGYLSLANSCMPKSAQTVRITQAELQIAQGQFEEALATLQRVREDRPKHPYVLRMLAQVYREVGDWDALAALQPKLKRYNALTHTELTSLEHELAAERLQLGKSSIKPLSVASDGDTIRQRWRALSNKQRQDLELRQIYVRELLAMGDETQAAAAIADGLKQHWDEELLLAYSRLTSEDVAAQLKQVEKWLKQHQKDPVLLLVAGRLCQRHELWGKARSYLEASVALQPRRDTYEELARLYLQLGETGLAQQAYQEALAQQPTDEQSYAALALPSQTDDDGMAPLVGTV